MDKLTELAIKYKTDKWGKHAYTPYYYEMFKNRRKSVKKVLEIGVGEGAGLRMWRDFFPNAIIYGADNQADRVFIDPPIQVFRCDQSREKDLVNLIEKTGTDIDLVVDDGSHKPSDQIFTCMVLMPLLRKDTTYVVEDVAELAVVGFLSEKYVTNTIQCSNRYDDRLVVVKHK